MIENFKENRLIKLLVLTVGLISVFYIAMAFLLMYLPESDSMLFLLPTIDTASFTEGQTT